MYVYMYVCMYVCMCLCVCMRLCLYVLESNSVCTFVFYVCSYVVLCICKLYGYSIYQSVNQFIVTINVLHNQIRVAIQDCVKN